MSLNGISDDGLVALSEALVVNTSLRHIDLGDNPVADAGSHSHARADTRGKMPRAICIGRIASGAGHMSIPLLDRNTQIGPIMSI